MGLGGVSPVSHKVPRARSHYGTSRPSLSRGKPPNLPKTVRKYRWNGTPGRPGFREGFRTGVSLSCLPSLPCCRGNPSRPPRHMGYAQTHVTRMVHTYCTDSTMVEVDRRPHTTRQGMRACARARRRASPPAYASTRARVTRAWASCVWAWGIRTTGHVPMPPFQCH